MNKFNSICLVALAVGWSSMLFGQTQSYEFVMRANEVPMFNQTADDPIVTTSDYISLDVDVSLDDIANSLNISPVFEWTWNPNFSIDLSAIGGPDVSILNHPIGYDLDLAAGFDYTLGMRHELDTGWFDIQMPLKVDITVDDYNRGRIATVRLDSTFTSNPQLNPSAPDVEKTLFMYGRVHGQGDFTLYTGPFGSGQEDISLYNFDESGTWDILTTGSSKIGGWGLYLDPANSACSGGIYDYTQQIGSTSYTGESNLCWLSGATAYCLAADQLDTFCKFGDWYTTGDAMEVWLPLGFGATLKRPRNELTQHVTNLATGVLQAQTSTLDHPHMQLNHSLHTMIKGIYQTNCLKELAGLSDPQANSCEKFGYLDVMNTHNSLFWTPFRDAVGRVGILQTINNISSAFGGQTFSMDNWNIWFEYDVLDFETHFNVENEMDVTFTPTVRVRLMFPEPVEWRYTSNDPWQVSNTVDMPLEGQFEIQTTCDDYELAFVPEFYMVEEDNMKNDAQDVYTMDLELEALQFNVGMNPIPIIPSFTFDFPCAGSVGEFFESVANCAASVMAPIGNTICTSPCYFPGVCTQIGGCFDPCFGVFGGCEICTPTAGGQSSSQCEDCVTALTCFQNSYECTLCEYGFPGLTIPGFNLAEDIGVSAVNDYGNKVIGFNEVWTVSTTDDAYLSAEWTIEGLSAVKTSALEQAFVPDSTIKSASTFAVNDVFVMKSGSSPRSTTAVLQFDAVGGTPPLYASSTTSVGHETVTVQLDNSQRSSLRPATYGAFTISDESGCISDTPQGLSQDLERNLVVPYVQPDVFNYCSDNDNDGCNDCASGSYDLANDGPDADGDGICDFGETDDDDDGVIDGNDLNPTNRFICGDFDEDGCDDCSSGSYDPANDGIDVDGDGLCDSSDNDADGDGLENSLDTYPEDASQCGSHDGDSCDDCNSGTYDPNNDGLDTDGDGLCDASDPDIDNDGRLNGEDSQPLNANACADTDADGCDDCSSGTFDTSNDGTDTDGDGLCDSGDADQDNDGKANGLDSAPLNPIVCGDSDGDGCDDCISGTYDPNADGADLDSDGICDSGDDDIDGDGVANNLDEDDSDDEVCRDLDEDTCDDCSASELADNDGDGICDSGDDDDDNDGILDASDSDPMNAYICGDFDGDTCDDCASGAYDPFNDGTDTDGDGLCDSGDPDKDGDGVLAVGGGSLSDSDDMNPNVCLDWDGDGCDDCLNGTFDIYDDGTDTDGDVFCDSGDNCSDMTALNYDDPNNVACIYAPTVATSMAIGQWTWHERVLNGQVSSDGGAAIVNYGFKWGTNADLTASDSLGFSGSASSLQQAISMLSESTTYYFVAFASNSGATSFGDTLSFTTPAAPCTGLTSVTYGGYDYDLVEIGEQCWFAENLRSDTYANGDLISAELTAAEWAATASGAQTHYDSTSANLNSYGRLYNWFAVNDARGLCPSGWHVPSDGEFTELTNILSGPDDPHPSLLLQGDKMKSSSSDNPGWDGTNASGFSALPGGKRTGAGGYQYALTHAYFWSSTQYGSGAGSRELVSSSEQVGAMNEYQHDGQSVRCVLD